MFIWVRDSAVLERPGLLVHQRLWRVYHESRRSKKSCLLKIPFLRVCSHEGTTIHVALSPALRRYGRRTVFYWLGFVLCRPWSSWEARTSVAWCSGMLIIVVVAACAEGSSAIEVLRRSLQFCPSCRERTETASPTQRRKNGIVFLALDSSCCSRGAFTRRFPAAHLPCYGVDHSCGESASALRFRS